MQDKNKISINQSLSISMIRVIATLMIVSCHILQGMNNLLAWWLNVGVQIFLFMSGFLLGNSTINKTSVYLKKRIRKLLIPYYIFLLFMLMVYYIKGILISKKAIAVYTLGIQGLKYKYQYILPGIEHLWFITIILTCYILVLGLDKFRYETDLYTENKFYKIIILILVVIQIFIIFTMDFEISYAAWIGAFLFGYLISYRYKFYIPKKLIKIMAIIVTITIPIRIYYQYFKQINKDSIKFLFYNLYIPWTHMILGCFLFMIMYNLFSNLNKEKTKLNKLLKSVDKYSYEIYLTHQVFILGPFSLLHWTDSILFNLLSIVILIGISSYILNKLTYFICKKIKYPHK